MPIPKEIIDNSEGNKLVGFLNNVLKENPKTNFDIATAFFNIQAFDMIKDHLNGVKSFRLLLGKTPEIQNEKTLGDVLLQEIRKEIEGFDLTKEQDKTIKLFIEFLKRKDVEIRLFERFLHGKTYIFDDRIVIGSSNFTAAGLTRYGELNTWQLRSQAEYTKREWFEKFWLESRDFKDELIGILESSRFGSKEYLPYEIYIKTLYELQKEDIKEEDKKEKPRGLPETKVNLAQFQDDAIARIWTRLKKYGGCIVADSVGLGKTWIAKKILEKIGYYERKNILIICPAQLMGMWSQEMKKIDVKENILSQENLASENFLEKAKKTLGGRFDDVELIVVDESHNFRNPLSNRWENFFTLVNDNIAKKGKKPYMLFLTATPINNTPWDLYWQIMLLILMDRSSFIKENIPDLFKFFKQAKDNPSLLNDLLNEISIRRTRDYIIENYPDAYILIEKPNGERKEQKIVFPDRVLENINYQLDKAYKGMYKEISDTITEKLTMAYYNILEYRKEGLKTEEERLALGRMIAIGGIFRTILLKRLESSVDAFRKSIFNHIRFLEELKSHLKSGKLLTKQTFVKYVMRADEEIGEEDLSEVLEKFELKSYNTDKLFKDIDKDIKLLSEILEKIDTIKPEDDSKLKALKERLLNLSKDGQVILFTYYADTLNYIYNEIIKDEKFSKLKIEAISSSGLTSKNPQQREKIVEKLFKKEIDILMSTDVLSEGQNLQTAKYLINYDLHWNPTRMIQRAGRIDRIGSPYEKIFVYNFFPEDELEGLLKLVEILQNKIIDIDKSVGLDQTILGEEIHPKVFGVIRKIKEKDSRVFAELEQDAFGGGEKFYQPLKDFLKKRALDELEKIPHGVFSGLKKDQISGIFFYYKYGNDFHFWYLYDVNTGSILTNKTEIIDFISCKPNKERDIPNFFEKTYGVNKIIVEDIERAYKEIELSQTQDSKLKELSKSRSTKFVKSMITEIELQIDSYLNEFPDDDSIEKFWEPVKNKLISIPPTKKRLQVLRRIWRQYKKDNDWKEMIKELSNFLMEKGIFKKTIVEPFDKSKLQLITIDFIS
ncbi:MAG: helicase-related protein [Methanocellales archaeon]|nr:helicase-related protein [Methanocellales archaeon]MDD3292202.1 helicase-related protein [Methanocellales archaeon]MDD5235731.1 helicase-related protein [Methanocellales archaeon]MDD5485796.1 helicase-related protein [Methanocellales archaeon]